MSQVYSPHAWTRVDPVLDSFPLVSLSAVLYVRSSVHRYDSLQSPQPTADAFIFVLPVAFVRYLDNPGRVWAAVVFNDTTAAGGATSSSSALHHWHYTIRVNGSFTATTDPNLQTVDSSNFDSVDRNETNKYIWTGAALLQWGLDQAIARVASGGMRDLGVPDYPQYNKNAVTAVRQSSLPLPLSLSPSLPPVSLSLLASLAVPPCVNKSVWLACVRVASSECCCTTKIHLFVLRLCGRGRFLLASLLVDYWFFLFIGCGLITDKPSRMFRRGSASPTLTRKRRSTCATCNTTCDCWSCRTSATLWSRRTGSSAS